MASKTIAWADQSGDVITMTAPAWSGSQTVTLSTPENFGIARELNIVFYSESNPAVSATLNVKQAEATLALSETSLVFASNDTSEKTVTVTTNMSTLDGAQLTLEGDTASDFTLSELSALSNGQATFTIKPNSANNSQDPRNVTIKLTAGRLATLSLPVTQDANAVQSVTYENYRLQEPSIYYNSSPLVEGTTVEAKEGNIDIAGTPVRDKVVTYVSGEVERTTEQVPESDTLYLSIYLETNGGNFRVQASTIEVKPSDLSSGFSQYIESLGTNLFAEDSGTLSLCIAPDKEVVASVLVSGLLIQGNVRESYSGYEATPTDTVEFGWSAGSNKQIEVEVTATCLYTSGASRKEYVPCSAEFSTVASHFRIDSSTSATPGVTPSSNKVSISTMTANTSGKGYPGTLVLKPKFVSTSDTACSISLIQHYHQSNANVCEITNGTSVNLSMKLTEGGVPALEEIVRPGGTYRAIYGRFNEATLSMICASQTLDYVIRDAYSNRMADGTLSYNTWQDVLTQADMNQRQGSLPFKITTN